MRQITLLSVQFIFFAAIVSCNKENLANCSHDDSPKEYVEVDSNNPKVVFAAKVSLEEYEEIKNHSHHLIYDKVIKAEKQEVDNGLDYHVNYKTHLESSLFPVYICDALVYKDDKDVFYVKKVECKRSLYWP